MKKPLMISADIHIHAHQRSNRRFQECLKAFEWFLDEAQQRGAAAVVVGDLFHHRKFIDILIYQRTYELLEKYCQKGSVELTILLGNHDILYFDRTDVSSTTALRSIDGVQIISNPSIKKVGGWHCGFLPYTHEPLADLAVMADDAMDIPGRKILFGHIAVDGAVLHTRSGRLSDVAVEHDGDMIKVGPSVFQDWDRVFLGHYHAAQQLGNSTEYVGSPLQLSFGEADQEKHIIFYDPSTDEKEYIVNDFSPKHIILDRIPTIDEVRGNYVSATVPDIMDPEVVEARELLEKESLSLEFFPSKKGNDFEIENAADVLDSTDDLFKTFVDETCPEGLDPELLLSIGNEIKKLSESES